MLNFSTKWALFSLFKYQSHNFDALRNLISKPRKKNYFFPDVKRYFRNFSESSLRSVNKNILRKNMHAY